MSGTYGYLSKNKKWCAKLDLFEIFAESDLPVVISRGDNVFSGFGNEELYHLQQGCGLKIKKHEILSKDIIKITAMRMENNQKITFLTQQSKFNDFFERIVSLHTSVFFSITSQYVLLYFKYLNATIYKKYCFFVLLIL